MPNINRAVEEIKRIAKDNRHGYDQKNRYGPDYDCSSLVAHCLRCGDFDVSKYSWTGNLYAQLKKCGFVSVKKPWKAGDIHLKVGKHVCMSISADKIAQASINEKGKTTGGKPGDQTGNEINTKKYYEYKGGWDYHLRYAKNNSGGYLKVTDAVVNAVIKGLYGNGEMRRVKLTQCGYDYDEVQKKVNKKLKGK